MSNGIGAIIAAIITVIGVIIAAYIGIIPFIGGPELVTVQGIVTDNDGKPVIGAVVEIDGSAVTTGSDGGYVIHGVPINTKTITVRAHGAEVVKRVVRIPKGDEIIRYDINLPQPVAPTPSEVPLPSTPIAPTATPLPPSPTLVPLTPTPTPTPWPPAASGLRVTGRVLWTTVPVPGARIELKELGNYYSMPVLIQTVVDADGRFTIENPPAGSYMIYAISPSDEYWKWRGHSIEIPVGAEVDVGTLYLKKKLQLLEPADGTTVKTTTPTLRWSSFPGATRYSVGVHNDETGQAVLNQDTTDTSLVVAPPLEPGVRYQWSVDANNAEGLELAYYSAWHFTVQP